MFDDDDAMFGSECRKGLRAEVKFAVAATYEKFAATWEIPVGKLGFVDIWSGGLSDFTVTEVNVVADFCVKELRSPPTLGEYLQLCNRLRDGTPLSEPMVSPQELMAYRILTGGDFHEGSFSLLDACLIVASIGTLKAYAEMTSTTPHEHIRSELTRRLNMFFAAALEWQLDAKEGKGYWAEVFAGKGEIDP
jgi:hypothetical protein